MDAGVVSHVFTEIKRSCYVGRENAKKKNIYRERMSVTAASYLAFFFSPVNPATLLSTVSADDYEAYE